MDTASVVTLLAIVATGSIAATDLARAEFVLTNSAAVGGPESWLTTLGLLKAAGAVRLAFGVAGVPLGGTAAALGLTLFFVGAIVTHVQAHNHDPLFPGAYLALAFGSLVLWLAA
jgi:hypothetical protein